MLDDLLEEVANRTNQIVAQLQVVTYEELEQLTGLRDKLEMVIKDHNSISNVSQKELINQIIKHDNMIANRMQQLKDEAAEQLRKVYSSNTQKSAYESKGSMGGFMFDHKN